MMSPVRTDLPSGTVTFLFTDVAGSTSLLDDLGSERYAEALAEHRRVVRGACVERAGVEVDTQGDAFFIAFPTAPAALAAARAIVEGLTEGPIRVRIGVHTGTPLLTDEGYVGPDVHRAARIAAAGHGGQVLVSSSSLSLLDGEVLRDLGEHRFKDLAEAERVFQLGEAEFPPIASLYRTNFPVPPTPFLGRARELAEAAELIERHDVRLVTLTGPGGTGKTRLATQAAAEAAGSFPDGLWWVSLAPLRDARLLVFTLAQALGVDEQPGRALAGSLADRLAGARALLLVDNAEHLLPEIAGEIARLRDSPGPTIVVTSRERLQLQGEHVYAVPPLESEDGVALFVSRARALNSAVAATPALEALCARLDNLPLALELAAARTVLFTPEQLLDRISEHLDLLRAGRDADPRQQTLRATIEWSYQLLDADERRLFRALSVFTGCTYATAEEICEADPDTLQSLLDKSLLRRRDAELPRFWMLETIRELAAEKLRSEGEADALRRRHAEHYLAIAQESNLDAESEGPQRHDLVLPERDNMLVALAWALENDRELGLELFVSLENYWATNSPQEGIDWAVALLDGNPDVPDRLVARALRVQGGMENIHRNTDVAEQLFETALAIARTTGDERGVAVLLHRVANTAAQRGDWQRVRALAEESLAGNRRVGFPKGEAQALTSLADVAQIEGDLARALELHRESRDICERIGFRWWLAGNLAKIGAVSLELGRLDEARESAAQALSLSHAMRDTRAQAYELSLLAEIEARTGERRRAGTLWGAAEAEQERASGRWIHGALEPERIRPYVDAEFERAREEGQLLELDAAVALALGDALALESDAT